MSAQSAPHASAVTGPASSASAHEVIVELRLWQHVDNAGDTWISARPAGGRWDALGTIPFAPDTHGFSLDLHSFHWFRDLAVVGTELRVWQRHRAPDLFYVRVCVMRCVDWLKPFTQTDPRIGREVYDAWPVSADGRRVQGWSPLGMIPLRLDHGHSSSGRYRYGDLTVAVPVGNPGLAADREYLLALRDPLAGTGELNWSAATPTSDWEGVTVAGAPPRVTALNLQDLGLDGEIWGWLGDLTELSELRLDGNRLTGTVPSKLTMLTKLTQLELAGNSLDGCIPPPLRAAPQHDLALLALPDCDDPTQLPPWHADSRHDGTTARTYYWWRGALSPVFDLPRGREFSIYQAEDVDDQGFVDCPPCEPEWYTPNALVIAFGDYSPSPRGALALSHVTREERARTHYEEDDPASFAIIERIVASLWRTTTHIGETAEWVWP